MNDGLRIGDADREAAARELGEHFALGRISVDEHAERLEQIWAARTAADLAPAFRDLPRPQAASTRPERPDRPGRLPQPWHSSWPRVPLLFKALVAIVLLWWGLHHLVFLLVGAAVYLLVVRRFTHRRRWRRWRGPRGPWEQRHYQAGWH